MSFYLNVRLPESNEFKVCKVTIAENYMDIYDSDKSEHKVSYHLGVWMIRTPRYSFGKPDVLEFYCDSFNQKAEGLYIHTYDPFDIIDFFDNVAGVCKMWNEKLNDGHLNDKEIIAGKKAFLFYKDTRLKVTANELHIDNTAVQLGEISILKISENTFEIISKKDVSLYKCKSDTDMKEFLNVFYHNYQVLAKKN